MVYGVLVYLIMTFVVVPLSAIGFRPPRSLILMLTSLAVHVFAFGLPISLVVSALLGARFASQSPQPLSCVCEALRPGLIRAHHATPEPQELRSPNR